MFLQYIYSFRWTKIFTVIRMCLKFVTLLLCAMCICTECVKLTKNTENENKTSTVETPLGCVCGVFLSGQFKKGSKEQPTGNPALLYEHTDTVPCSSLGNKICTNKCLDAIVKHLPNSAAILCASVDRDCHKERAYLFIKNCKDEWINTNLSAGKEYCCKDGIPYKCPILS